MVVNNNYFIINMVEQVINGNSTLFLNKTELKYITSILNKKHIKYNIFYPYSDAEKVIVYQNVIPKISVLEIKSKSTLHHKDILGSMFANNINPNNYGDIIITNGKYYLIVMDKLLKYFLTQINKIGKNHVTVEQVDNDLIKDYHFEYDKKQYLVSSLRLDNIVAEITNLSRSSSNELINNGDVLLNYENTKKIKIITEGDIISIRRYGKYKFGHVITKNKKGKLIIEILKYK